MENKKGKLYTAMMLLGLWLFMIGFLDENLLSFMEDPDQYQVFLWKDIAITATACGCFIAALVISLKNKEPEPAGS